MFGKIPRLCNIVHTSAQYQEFSCHPLGSETRLRSLDKTKNGYLFWWGLTKFLVDHVFSQQFVNSATLEVCYGERVTQRGVDPQRPTVLLQCEEF